MNTGLVRFSARDYDADVGRWLERDPILFNGRSTNLYAYSHNDPVNNIDPSGLKTTIHIYSNYAGHVSVQIGNDQSPSGFYPSDDSKEYEYLNTQGNLRNDGNRSDMSQKIEIDTTVEQEQKIRDYYQQHGNTDTYGVLGNNCATFAGKALKSSGVQAPTGEIIPAAFGWRMKYLNGN